VKEKGFWMDRATLTDALKEARLAGFDKAALYRYVEELKPLMRTAVRVLPEAAGAEEEIPLGASKLGGRPDLPAGTPWPVVDGILLEFVGQFRMEEVAPLDETGLLPRDGLLSFFFDGMLTGYVEGDFRDRCMVLQHNGPAGELTRTDPPEHLHGRAFRVFCPCRVAYEQTVNLPPSVEIFSDDLPAIHPVEFQEPETVMVYQDLRRRFWEPATQFLGNVVELQAEEEKFIALQRRYPGRYILRDGHVTHAEELAARLRDLVLLFTAASGSEAEIQWGDGGLVYFWMMRDDLASGRWDAVWATMVCG
jgi:uncharacterized protein YwqG